MKRVVIGGVGFLLVAAGVLMLVTAASSESHDRASARMAEINRRASRAYLQPPAETDAVLKDFVLTDRTGKTLDSKRLAGKVYVVNFFFASCPSVCKLQNGAVQKLQEEFADRGVRFLSITCDPEKDSPQALAKYAELFKARPDTWYFLTGDLGYIRRIGAEMYQLAVDKNTHSERLVAVDRAGQVRGAWNWNDPEEMAAMRAKLEELIAEPAPIPAT
jgi:cytochrome oxidase Cu insertion factor (SCO1/SenC/PrrC family)